MMPAGRYYVGDLCYVMHPQWSDVCNLMFSGSDPDGEFQLKNGVRFASLSTKYGDGCYSDQFNNSYPVDAGLIGCILVDDINDETADLNLGAVITFDEPFEVSYDDGTLYFGHITIETGDGDEEEYNEYDDEDEIDD